MFTSQLVLLGNLTVSPQLLYCGLLYLPDPRIPLNNVDLYLEIFPSKVPVVPFCLNFPTVIIVDPAVNFSGLLSSMNPFSIIYWVGRMMSISSLRS